jgi:hypothetical protein
MDATVSDCLKGKCECASAAECKFARCDNCDYPKDHVTGKTLVDHRCRDHEICPDCDGPLNDQRIYGALVD